MNTKGMESVRGGIPAAPGASYLIGSCAVVAMAAYLGADWLRKPLIGLPAGVWIVGVAYAAGYALALRRARGARLIAPAPAQLPMAAGVPAEAGWTGVDVALVAGRIAAAGWEATRTGLRKLGSTEEQIMELETRLGENLEGRTRTPRPLRIGVRADPELLSGLRNWEAQGEPRVEWIVVRGGDERLTMHSQSLDALVRREDEGPVLILTPENEGQEAAWFDWSLSRPLTYASVFPTRVDAAQATVAELDAGDPRQVRMLALLVRAAAAQSRIPVRLNLADRLRGRSRFDPVSGLADPDGGATPIERAMRDLVSGLLERPATGGASSVDRAAARVCSAWLTTTDSWIDPQTRQAGAEAALDVLEDEPEAMLRAGAIRLAAGQDVGAMQAFEAAAEALRMWGVSDAIDHVAFLQSEVECGLPGPLTLGRVAAGICLACACTSPERIPFIRGDFMDDVRHSAWLIGRDQDRAMLLSIFRRMERPVETTRLAA